MCHHILQVGIALEPIYGRPPVANTVDYPLRGKAGAVVMCPAGAGAMTAIRPSLEV